MIALVVILKVGVVKIPDKIIKPTERFFEEIIQCKKFINSNNKMKDKYNNNSITREYPLISKSNFKSYLRVLFFLIVISVVFAILLNFITQDKFILKVIFSFFAVMLGMMIMFVASAINLIKLRKGFERLAEGKEPNIPKVWCPVLTMATRASMKLVKNKKKIHNN